MLNKELEFTLNLAFKGARERQHEYVTVDHLLLALLDNTSAAAVLRSCGASIERIRKRLTDYVAKTYKRGDDGRADQDTQPSVGFQRVLQRAVFHVQSAGRTEVTGANVLAAIFSEQDCQGVYFLKQENVTRLDVLNYISHGISKMDHYDPNEQQHNDRNPNEESETDSSGALSPLESFATNLNARARAGLIDPLIGRDEEVLRMVQVLCRRRKNNPILVGESGVGKTAIAEGLAVRIVEHKVPEPLAAATVYSLDLGALLAGTKYRGDFEKRFKALIHHLHQDPHAILFIDEIHTIIGAGAASGGVMDASNLIKPLLVSGELKCIGSTTYQEYRGIFEKDRALARRFQKIDVGEPSVEDSYHILKGLRERLEKHHNVRYSLKALRSACELAARYINDRFLPDKAIDIIDEAGAYQKLLAPSKRKRLIGVAEIEEVVAKIARIPIKSVTASDREQLRHLSRDLKMLVFGQDEAIESLGVAIKLARSGLNDPRKPVGSFLFAGPTGVGKTEVTRQLARLLGVELVRFDMSEYMERHTVSRLIGAPPGYVGFDQGGLLTEAINKHPYSVLLLDEVEKAHPDVFNLLLQVMDHGTLTDNNGRKADFRHVIIVMTTNAGAEVSTRNTLGFVAQDHSTDALTVINKAFAPEFRNRLDAIIQFKPLSRETIAHVVDKFVMELEVQLEARDVKLVLDESAREWLALHGYDEKMGARPMARLIQEKIKRPLAEELLFGKLAQGGKVIVSEKDDDLAFEFVTDVVQA